MKLRNGAPIDDNGSSLRPAAPASTPITDGDLTERNVRTIAELEKSAKAGTTRSDRIAIAIGRFCGTMMFAWVQLAWVCAWIVVNVWLGPKAFDPFPFSLLGLVVSLEAVLLSTFILISQNRENWLAERRSHLDLQINLLTEQENTEMLRMLRSIADKVGAPVDDNPDLATLEQAIQPHVIAGHIDKAGETRAHDARAAAGDGTPPPTA